MPWSPPFRFPGRTGAITTMRWTALLGLLLGSFASSAVAAPPTLVIEDPLNGKTKGRRSGGSLTSQGFRIQGVGNYIEYLPGSVPEGYVEFQASNLKPDGKGYPYGGKGELIVMFDGTLPYKKESYDSDPFKVFIRKLGEEYANYGHKNAMKLLFTGREGYSPTLTWNPKTWYTFKMEWAGNKARLYRDGKMLKEHRNTVTYRPAKHVIHIGSSARNSAVIGTIYRNVKIYRYGGPQPPEKDDSKLLGHTIGKSVIVGTTTTVSVTMQNTGNTSWTPGKGYKLGAVDEKDPFTRSTRVELPAGATIKPTAKQVFRFKLTAPNKPGQYITDWRMVREGVRWFGATVKVAVGVRKVPVERKPEPPAPEPGDPEQPSPAEGRPPEAEREPPPQLEPAKDSGSTDAGPGGTDGYGGGGEYGSDGGSVAQGDDDHGGCACDSRAGSGVPAPLLLIGLFAMFAIRRRKAWGR